MMYGYVTPYRRPIGWSTFDRDARNTGFREQGPDLLSDLNRQINRLFEDVFDFSGKDDDNETAEQRGRRMKAPAIDIATFDERYELTAELPGVKQEDIELKVEDGLLVLKGEKKSAAKADDNTWSERRFGTFLRRIQLPEDVKAEQVEADFADGVLTITIPRAEKARKSRVIAIKTREENRKMQLIDDDSTRVAENA